MKIVLIQANCKCFSTWIPSSMTRDIGKNVELYHNDSNNSKIKLPKRQVCIPNKDTSLSNKKASSG